MTPDDLELPGPETLEMAQELLDRRRPFHAHEVLEARWKSCPEAERDLWHGLAQLAVGITHQMRGNTTGAIRLIARGATYLRPYATTAAPARVEEVDVAGILSWADATVTALEAGHGIDTVVTLRQKASS